MPYIPHSDRAELLNHQRNPKTAGELNYVLTQIILEYMNQTGRCYQSINDVMGALEGCKLELYRRLVAPYKDEKSKENGDVYYKDETITRTRRT